LFDLVEHESRAFDMRPIGKAGVSRRRYFGALGRCARTMLAAAVAALALVPVTGEASMVGFSCITPQASSNCAVAGGAGFTLRNLGPGGNGRSPAFRATPGLSASSVAPVQPRGVNPSASLTFVAS
jgi:hypothetical protein